MLLLLLLIRQSFRQKPPLSLCCIFGVDISSNIGYPCRLRHGCSIAAAAAAATIVVAGAVDPKASQAADAADAVTVDGEDEKASAIALAAKQAITAHEAIMDARLPVDALNGSRTGKAIS